jgi:hypothetical protein
MITAATAAKPVLIKFTASLVTTCGEIETDPNVPQTL